MASDFTRGIKVYLDSQGFGKGIKEMQQQTAKYRQELQKLDADGKSNSKEADKLRRHIEQNTKTEQRYNDSLAETRRVLENLSGATYKELINARNKVKAQLKTMQRDTQEYRDLLRVLQRTETELAAATNQMNAATDASQGVFTKLASFLHKYLVILTGVGAGLAGAIAAGRKAVNAFAELQEAEAQVAKYTGMTDDEVRSLNEALGKIDTRTSQLELNRLAAEAGKLGIKGVDDIAQFVDAADKINLSLGESMGPDAVKNIGKLAMMFGEDETKGLRGAMLSTASAAYTLATSSTASEPYLVEFAARLGGIANQAKISQADIMGLASVLDQNMQQVEMSSTAVSTLITKMFKDVDTFAGIANMSVKEFSKLLGEDANEALLRVLEAMNGKGGFKELVPLFDDMHMDGRRAVGVLSTLATKIADVRDAQKTANDAYNEGTSAVKAFDKMNNTVQANMDKAKKRLQAIRVELGEELRPLMSKIYTTGSLTVRLLADIVKVSIKYRTAIIAATIALAAYYLEVKRAVIADKLKVFWTDTLTTSFKALWATIKANPIGALLTVLTIGIALFKNLADNAKKANQTAEAMARIDKKVADEASDEMARIRLLSDTVHDNNLQLDARRRALDELKKIVPDYHADLTDENRLINDNSDALEGYMNNLMKTIRLKAAEEELLELTKQQMELERQLPELRKKESRAQTSLALNKLNKSIQAGSKLSTPGMQSMAVNMGNGQYEDAYNKAHAARVKAEADLEGFAAAIGKIREQVQQDGLVIASAVNPETASGGDGGGDTKKDDTQSAADAVREKYEALLEEADQYHDAAQNKLSASLARREITQQQYDLASNAENQRYYTDRIQIEMAYQDEVSAVTYDKETDRDKDIKVIRKQIYKDQQSLNDAQLADLVAFYKNMDAMEKMAAKDETDTLRKAQLERAAELATLEAYYTASLQYAREHGEDELVIEESYLAAKLAIENKYSDKSIDLEDKTERERQQVLKRYGMQTLRSQYEEDLKMLEQYHNRGLLSDKEYWRAKRLMAADYWTDMAKRYADYFSDTVEALQDAEIATSEAKYDVLIRQAENAGQETERLETEKANATLEIQKKYADANFAVKASQIIADTAVSIMKAYADLGPIAGSVAAALMTVTGVAQLASANAERRKVKQLSLQSTSAAGGTAERVVQHANGRYDVIGNEDGKHYHVPYLGSAETGIVRSPALVSESGAELIVSASDLQRLRRHINYPLVVDAINDSRRGIVRQHAQGSYNVPAATSNGKSGDVVDTLSHIATLIEQLPTHLRCYVVLSDLDEARDRESRSKQPFVRGDHNR